MRVFADDRPAPGMFVCVTIRTTRRNDYGLGIGPTDEHGELVLLRSELLCQAGSPAALRALRCGHPERDFAGEIVVRPLDRAALERADTAYRHYRQTALYSPEYAAQLQQARALLEAWLPCTLRSEVRLSACSALARGETTRV